MNGGWQALRAGERDIAFCLLFAPAVSRDLIADRLHLAVETENAIRLASEPMLAAIRLQWWVEAIEMQRHESVPLMQRLISHIDANRVSAEDLSRQVGLWQDRLTTAPEDVGSCWGEMFAMMLPDQREAAAQVGRALVDEKAIVGDEALHLLANADGRWAWMIGLLARYRRTDGLVQDDPLLVWRMLGWRFGVRLPSSAKTSR